MSKNRGYFSCWTSFFAKCLFPDEDGPGRGHLWRTDTFLVYNYFTEKINLEFHINLRQIMHMKCLALFSLKNEKWKKKLSAAHVIRARRVDIITFFETFFVYSFRITAVVLMNSLIKLLPIEVWGWDGLKIMWVTIICEKPLQIMISKHLFEIANSGMLSSMNIKISFTIKWLLFTNTPNRLVHLIVMNSTSCCSVDWKSSFTCICYSHIDHVYW